MSILLAASLALLVQAHQAPASAPAPKINYTAPEGWTPKAPSSRMRLAEFALPKEAGDPEDASLVVYFFGGQGGSVSANLDRWMGQMSQPDGRASKDVAKVSNLKSNDLAFTIVDVPGTFVAEVAPGSSEHFNKPGFHLRAAVIEGEGGPLFVRLVGPAKTVAKWDASIQAFFKSLRIE